MAYEAKKNNILERVINKVKANYTHGKNPERKEAPPFGYSQILYTNIGKSTWKGGNYNKFAHEAFIKNVIAHRAIQIIASGAASVSLIIRSDGKNEHMAVKRKLLEQLLFYPNPNMGGAEFFETVYAYKLISGNSYIQAIRSNDGIARELFCLRPDRVSVIAGGSSVAGYRYVIGDKYVDFALDKVTGQSDVLHLKNFHPLDDWCGLSSIEAAAYSIDQHNKASEWNQSLLQNGARPSGALIVKGTENNSYLSQEQYTRLKNQMEEIYSGAANAGRPMLLEGCLEWREMSLSPRDMDFLNIKHSAARDIALAFGVPPQLLGIPGDSTYNNMAEARLALWEQTIIPLLESTIAALNNWLVPMFSNDLTITYDKNTISALMPRREALWSSLKDVSFLSDEEKRAMLGV